MQSIDRLSWNFKIRECHLKKRRNSLKEYILAPCIYRRSFSFPCVPTLICPSSCLQINTGSHRLWNLDFYQVFPKSDDRSMSIAAGRNDLKVMIKWVKWNSASKSNWIVTFCMPFFDCHQFLVLSSYSSVTTFSILKVAKFHFMVIFSSWTDLGRLLARMRNFRGGGTQ